MKYLKSFGIIAIGFIVYLLTNWLNPPKEISPIFIGGLTALIIWLSQKHFDSGRSEASFKEQISSLNNEKDEIRFNYQKTISNLKAENNELVEKLSKYTHREKLLSKYTHDEDWGYWTHIETKKNYCHKCLIDNDPPKESPLKNSSGVWECMVCKSQHYISR